MNSIDRDTVRREDDGTYVVSDDRVLSGASLGNSGAWIVCKATGAIQKVFSLALGHDVMWSTVITYGSPRHRVLVGLEPAEFAADEHLREAGGHIKLAPFHPGKFEFHPAYQRHSFTLPTSVKVTETTFVPRTGYDDPAVAYIVLDLHNSGSSDTDLLVHVYTKLRGRTPPDVQGRYDPAIGAIVAHNASHPEWVRIVGPSIPPAAYQTAFHADEAYDSANVAPLDNSTMAQGNILAALAVSLSLAAGERKSFAFVLAFSERGEGAAREIYHNATDYRSAFERTVAFYAHMMSRSQVLTPDQTINDGAMWAKANMVRVVARYPQGLAFTNDPGSSSAVVGRDLAWFAMGCDYLDSGLSRELLLRYARTQYADGLMPEYFNAVTGTPEDYGLNINDNTPLFVHACAHHYSITHDDSFLDAVWPVIVRACDYIIAQLDERGLVVCTATGEDVHGICGWRNIIPRYTINGAVTEVNAECYAALGEAASLAHSQARRLPAHRAAFEKHAERYARAAHELREAINDKLLNPNNGMYVLNIGLDGDVHSDVTGDEVFPVLFDVAPHAVAYRIIRRLADPDFQTEAGLRTVSRRSPDYTPYRDVGLIGGVWPGLSFWYARAAARIYPDAMAQNLKQSYAHYLRDPKIFNTVPGQFSEWFDGESLINRGMRLSPWEPPRFLWAAITGACGLLVNAHSPHKVEPLMPSGWTWLGVRRMVLAGREMAYFVVRSRGKFTFFTTGAIDAEGQVEVYDEDASDQIEVQSSDLAAMAFKRGSEIMLCLGSTSSSAHAFPLSLHRLLDNNRRYAVNVFDPVRATWVESEPAPGRLLSDIALRIDAQSYALVRFNGSS